MKNIFLASIARNTIDQFIKLNKLKPKNLKVAFIPTAGTPMEESLFIQEDRKKLVHLGFNVVDVNLENKNKAQLEQEMIEIDIIFVAGGNTFYLLQETLKSGFDKTIIQFIEKGGLYIGSSAGTLLAGPSIELAKDIDNQNEALELKSYKGLNLVDFVVLPHCDDPEFKEAIEENLKTMKPKYKTIKIIDDQAVWIENENIWLIDNKHKKTLLNI